MSDNHLPSAFAINKTNTSEAIHLKEANYIIAKIDRAVRNHQNRCEIQVFVRISRLYDPPCNEVLLIVRKTLIDKGYCFKFFNNTFKGYGVDVSWPYGSKEEKNKAELRHFLFLLGVLTVSVSSLLFILQGF